MPYLKVSHFYAHVYNDGVEETLMRNETKAKLKAMLEKPWAANAAALCIGILFWYLLASLPAMQKWVSYIVNTVSSVLIGVILAYLINPVCNFIEDKVLGSMKNRKHAHTVSVVLALLLVILLVTLFLIILVPSILASLNTLIENISLYVRSTDKLIEQLEAMAANYGIDLSAAADKVSEIIDGAIKNLPGYLSDFILGSFRFGASMASILIGIIFAVYFLTGKKAILKAVHDFRHAVLREETVQRHDTFLRHCDQIMTSYVGFTLLDALIVGFANALFMVVMGIPYVGLVSTIVALTNLLPTFGPMIGAVVGGLLLVLHNPLQAVYFLIFTVVLQTIDGYILKPRLFSGSLGVPSILILIAVVIGGELFGVAGIILAIPAAAIITYIYHDLLYPVLLKRRHRIDHTAE